MATMPVSTDQAKPKHQTMTFEKAMEVLSRDDRFKATVYAMNSLLVQKGIYSPEEFEFQFCQFAAKNARA